MPKHKIAFTTCGLILVHLEDQRCCQAPKRSALLIEVGFSSGALQGMRQGTLQVLQAPQGSTPYVFMVATFAVSVSNVIYALPVFLFASTCCSTTAGLGLKF